MLLFNAGIVVTRETIYERIWGFDFETSSKSLDVYIGYLRRKTEAEGEARIIHTVRGVGYIARDRMSLRLRIRLALVVAMTFAVVVIGCVYAAHVSARNAAARRDRPLPARNASTIRASTTTAAHRGSGRRGEPDAESTQHRSPNPDAVVQLIDGRRDVQSQPIAGQPALPVDAHDKQIATESAATAAAARTSRSTARPTA